MKDGSSLPRLLRGVLLLVCVSAAAGCTHPKDSPPGFVDTEDAVFLEAACENNLQYLEKIIKEFEAKNGTSDALLIEATEIFRMAESLYLQREFKLASDWIEDAIRMLEEPSE
jgi:hypothetical protein